MRGMRPTLGFRGFPKSYAGADSIPGMIRGPAKPARAVKSPKHGGHGAKPSVDHRRDKCGESTHVRTDPRVQRFHGIRAWGSAHRRAHIRRSRRGRLLCASRGAGVGAVCCFPSGSSANTSAGSTSRRRRVRGISSSPSSTATTVSRPPEGPCGARPPPAPRHDRVPCAGFSPHGEARRVHAYDWVD